MGRPEEISQHTTATAQYGAYGSEQLPSACCFRTRLIRLVVSFHRPKYCRIHRLTRVICPRMPFEAATLTVAGPNLSPSSHHPTPQRRHGAASGVRPSFQDPYTSQGIRYVAGGTSSRPPHEMSGWVGEAQVYDDTRCSATCLLTRLLVWSTLPGSDNPSSTASSVSRPRRAYRGRSSKKAAPLASTSR